MGIFERYLSLWVASAIVTGVALGLWIPGVFEAVARLEWANVNLVVAALICCVVSSVVIQRLRY